VNLYFRLGDAEHQRGSSDGELAYYRQALDVCRKWVSESAGPEATSNLRDAYHEFGSALARSGNLHAARDSFQRAEKLSEELGQQKGTRIEHSYNAISLQTSFGDVLGATDDPNFGDRAGAVSHYRKAAAIAESLAAADPQNRNARRNVASCYRRLGMMHVDDNPAAGLDYYRKALKISEDLNTGEPTNLEYLYAVSRAHMGVGEALHNLRRNDEAISNLQRAVELQNAIAATSPGRIWNLRILSRTYALLGRSWLQRGDQGRALGALRNGLAAADRILQRAPHSLYHQLDRADVLEALGRYYAALAAQPRGNDERRAELRNEARSCFQQSLAIWQSWHRRKVGAPYAAHRERQMSLAIASLGGS
jgi:tetratricopeptide (TPR) repeat protein